MILGVSYDNEKKYYIINHNKQIIRKEITTVSNIVIIKMNNFIDIVNRLKL